MLYVNILLALTFFILSSIHFYWAVGGKWAFHHVLPTNEQGERVLHPKNRDSVIVGLALFLFAVVYFAKTALFNLSTGKDMLVWAGWIIPAIFLLRAIGDFKYVGFFKKVKSTTFGKADTKLFSPLCLAIGIAGILSNILQH